MKWEKNNILLAFCALKIIIFVEKNNVATTCYEIKFCCAAKRKKIFIPKKTIAPPPFKLNGCSLSLVCIFGNNANFVMNILIFKH